MQESGPRKRDEDGDVDEDDHRGDDSPPDGTPAPLREREEERFSPLCFLLHGLPPGWGDVLPLALGLHGDDCPFEILLHSLR